MECSISRDNSSKLSFEFEKLEETCGKPDHTKNSLNEDCFFFRVSFNLISEKFAELGKDCKELSHNCIALGQATSNQKLSEYVEKTQELKAENRKMETASTKIKLKLM